MESQNRQETFSKWKRKFASVMPFFARLLHLSEWKLLSVSTFCCRSRYTIHLLLFAISNVMKKKFISDWNYSDTHQIAFGVPTTTTTKKFIFSVPSWLVADRLWHFATMLDLAWKFSVSNFLRSRQTRCNDTRYSAQCRWLFDSSHNWIMSIIFLRLLYLWPATEYNFVPH